MNASSLPTSDCEQDVVSCPAGTSDLRAAKREEGCVVAASGMAPSDPCLLVFIAM